MMKRWLVVCVFICLCGCSESGESASDQPVEEQAGAGSTHYVLDLDSLVKAVSANDAQLAEKALREFHDEGGTIGLDCSFEFSREDLDMCARTAVEKTGPLREAAVMLLSRTGGYRANTAFVELLRSKEFNPILWDVIDALRSSGDGDPRVGPAIWEARIKWPENVNTQVLAFVMYKPSAPSVRDQIDKLLVDSWWLDEQRSAEVVQSLGVLGQLGDRESIALYNRALADVVAWAKSGTLGNRPGEYGDDRLFLRDFLYVAHTIWDESTLGLLMDLVSVVPPNPERVIPSIPYVTLVSRMCKSAFPWIGDSTVDELRIIRKQFLNPEEFYIGKLRSGDLDLERARRVSHILATRGATRALPEIEKLLQESAPDSLVRLNVARDAVALGSWRGIEALLEISRDENNPLAPFACSSLRGFTAGSFRKNWDVWDWWLDRAKAELHWDVHTNSWQPADKWEALQIEALARLDAKPE